MLAAGLWILLATAQGEAEASARCTPVALPDAGLAWTYCRIDPAGVLYVQPSRSRHVLRVDCDGGATAAVTEMPLVSDGGWPVVDSLEAIGPDRYVITLGGGKVLMGSAAHLVDRPELALELDARLHRAAGNGWWLVEQGKVFLFENGVQSRVMLPPELEKEISWSSASPSGELLFSDLHGHAFQIAGDGHGVAEHALGASYEPSRGFEVVAGTGVVCSQTALLVLSSPQRELPIHTPTAVDRPIWRPFSCTDGRLFLVEARAGRVYRCELEALPGAPPRRDTTLEVVPTFAVFEALRTESEAR